MRFLEHVSIIWILSIVMAALAVAIHVVLFAAKTCMASTEVPRVTLPQPNSGLPELGHLNIAEVG